MSTLALTFVIALVLVLVLVVVYWYASRMKRSLDAAPAFQPHPPLTVELTEASAASLDHLSQEPILLKQSEDGTRVQIDDRPLVLLSILTDTAAAAALREIVADVSARDGMEWTALVTTRPDGSIRVQRLA